jgi:hypothetical protein
MSVPKTKGLSDTGSNNEIGGEKDMMTKQEARQQTCDGCGKEFVIGFCQDCQTPDYDY